MPDATPAVSSLPAASARAETPAAFESNGHWCLTTSAGDVRCAFYGKATTGVERDLEASLERSGIALAHLRQIHSARVIDAVAGPCGEGDSLVTHDRGLALRVVTADCVPVLLAADAAIAAVHAGWRGLAAGILTAAVERLGGNRSIRAVIGPAIGACCYEVGPEVAEQVARRAGSDRVIVDRGPGSEAEREARAPGARPHLDLVLATRLELARAGVEEVSAFDVCTRCDAARWWSYRREGKRAGRNVALIWRER